MKNTDYSLEEIILLKQENQKLKDEIGFYELLKKSNPRSAGRKNIPESIQEEIYQKSKSGEKAYKLSKDYSYSPATIYSIIKKQEAKQTKKIEEPFDVVEVAVDEDKQKQNAQILSEYFSPDFFS